MFGRPFGSGYAGLGKLSFAKVHHLPHLPHHVLWRVEVAPVSRESYEAEGAPGPSLLGTGEGGEADWQLGLHSGNCQPLRWMIIDRQGTTK